MRCSIKYINRLCNAEPTINKIIIPSFSTLFKAPLKHNCQNKATGYTQQLDVNSVNILWCIKTSQLEAHNVILVS